MSNYDQEDQITVMTSSLYGKIIAIGTMKGNIYIVNRFNGHIESQYTPHGKAITGIYIRESAPTSSNRYQYQLHSVVSCSKDGMIKVIGLREGV